MSRPLVSVCIPTHNAEATIGETLASILAQTYADLEVLVVDNASTDGTLSVVERLRDPRVTIHRSDRNIGAEANFTRCFSLARGEYTAIYHADDLYHPMIVEKEASFLFDHPEAGAVFTAAALIDEDSRPIGRASIPRRFVEPEGWKRTYDFRAMFREIMRYTNFLICPSAMVRTSIYQHEIGEWQDSRFGCSADLHVWLRILRRHEVGILPACLVKYRLSRTHFSYAYHLDRTGPNDFFAVMDHYLSLDDVKGFVTGQDVAAYERAKRVDRLLCAFNLVLAEHPDQAAQLCSDVTWTDMFHGIRGMKAFALGFALRVTLALGNPAWARSLLGRLRRKR